MYCLYLVVLFSSAIGIFQLYSKHTQKILVLLWFCLFVFVGTFAYFSDDYEPYVNLTELAYVSPLSYTHVESLWVWFMGLFYGNVDAFRFVSFLFLSILLVAIAKCAKTSLLYFLFCYTLLCMSAHICWIRQPIAYGIFLLSLLVFPKSKFAFVALFVLSLFLHKSTILLVFVFPFMLFSLRKKIIWIYILLAFPMAVISFYSIALLVQNTFGIPLDLYFSADSEYTDRNVIFLIISKISIIAHLVIIVNLIFLFKEEPDVHILVRCLFGVLFIFLLLIVLPIENNVISKRLLSFGNLIVALVCSIKIKNNFLKKKYLYLFLLMLILISLREIAMLGNNYTNWDKLLKVPHLF